MTTPDSLALTGFSSIRLITPASVASPKTGDDFTASLSDEILKFSRPDSAVIVGRYVQATIPNLNGHEFSLEGLIGEHKTILNTPLNMLHDKKDLVGTYVAAEMRYPATDPTPELGAPWVDAASLFWKRNAPEKWIAVEQAARNGMLWYSMEAIGQTVTCRTDGCCGETFPFRGVVSPTYCQTMQSYGARLRINDPFFVGGALVLPPARPGWAQADIQTIAATVQEHLDDAELIYEAIATRAAHLKPNDWEQMMGYVLADLYEGEPEPKLRTATKMPEIDPLAAELIRQAPNFGVDIKAVADNLGINLTIEPIEAAGGGRGAMICVELPDEITAQLADLDGVDEPRDKMHLTLAYLGKIDDPGPDPEHPILTLPGPDGPIAAARVEALTGAIAAVNDPIPAAINGLGRWPEGNPADGVECVVALVDAPGINDLQHWICEELDWAGVPLATNHSFTPHIALHYGAPGSGPTTIPNLRFTIDSIAIWWGSFRRAPFPLGRDAAVEHWNLSQDLAGSPG